MDNMKLMMSKADEKTICLKDELGNTIVLISKENGRYKVEVAEGAYVTSIPDLRDSQEAS